MGPAKRRMIPPPPRIEQVPLAHAVRPSFYAPPIASSIHVLCPMSLEGRAVLRALAGLDHVRVDVCGVGPAAVRRWAENLAAPPEFVILAGVAGGLAPQARLGEARHIVDVAMPDGRIVPTSGRMIDGWRVAGSDALLATPQGKRDLAARTGAHVVDMESHAFADEATRRAWRFAIVRGVSDSIDDGLPDGLERLLDERGRVRPLGVAALLVRRPRLVGALREFGRRCDEAMRNVAPLVRELIEESVP